LCELSFYLALLDKITDFPLANMLFVANIRGFLVFHGEYSSCAKTQIRWYISYRLHLFKLIDHNMALTLEIWSSFFIETFLCVFDRNHTFKQMWYGLTFRLIEKTFLSRRIFKILEAAFYFNCSFSFKRCLWFYHMRCS